MVEQAKQVAEQQFFIDENWSSEIGFKDAASGEWVVNPWMSPCGRFEVQPMKKYGVANFLEFVVLANTVEKQRGEM